MRRMMENFVVTFVAILLLCAMIFFIAFDNAKVTYNVGAAQLTDIPPSVLQEKKRRYETASSCLVVSDSSLLFSHDYAEHVKETLDLMRIGYDVCDVSEETLPLFSDYETVVIAMENLENIGDRAVDLCEWVKGGGRCMLANQCDNSPVFSYLSRYLGIVEGLGAYIDIGGISISNDFMIGADEGFSLNWTYGTIPVSNFRVDGESLVYVSSNDESHVPLIWERSCGDGKFVMMNHSLHGKESRGMTCAAFSLLEDVSAWPVINASAFFIDDFPSPVPMGTAEFVSRDYNCNISSFYANIWWPDMVKLAQKYGLKYTGFIIEEYTDNVTGPFTRQTATERFMHFGSQLLDNGGEIGLHGYNHQPLCLTGFDFKDIVDYNTWFSLDEMQTAFDELVDYSVELFPDARFAVYVPPSNILSDEGRAFLAERYPQIKLISGLYMEGEIEYSQEFEIADDGIVEFPRITSGSIIDWDVYFSELCAMNLYYINSHFIHPDDALDPDRGAELGWEALKNNMDGYLDWIYTSCPGLRNLTATDAGRATARYDTLSLERHEDDKTISLRFSGFWDEAYLLMRFNEGAPAEITGGDISHVSGDFYLLRADSQIVTITKKGE